MKNPLVSIIVPVYNVEKYIERCARSIFEQTYHNLEIIFVDDCTPDNSIKILRKVIQDYPEREEQVKILRHNKNRGLAAVRNTGVAAATGYFLMHVDSDDWIEVYAIESLVQKQEEDNADIVTGLAVINENFQVSDVSDPHYQSKREMLDQIITTTTHHSLWPRLINLNLYRKYDIRSIEGLNVGEDWRTLAILTWYSRQISTVNKIIYHYNRSNNLSYTSYNSVSDFYKDQDFKRQTFLNYNSLISFFQTKDIELYRKSIGFSLYMCFTYMYDAVYNSSEDAFSNWRMAFASICNRYKFQIGLRNTLFYIICKLPKCYSLMRCIRNIKGLLNS